MYLAQKCVFLHLYLYVSLTFKGSMKVQRKKSRFICEGKPQKGKPQKLPRRPPMVRIRMQGVASLVPTMPRPHSDGNQNRVASQSKWPSLLVLTPQQNTPMPPAHLAEPKQKVSKFFNPRSAVDTPECDQFTGRCQELAMQGTEGILICNNI